MNVTNLRGYEMTMAEMFERFGLTPVAVAISAIILAFATITLVILIGLWVSNNAKAKTDPSATPNRFVKPTMITAGVVAISLTALVLTVLRLFVLMADYGIDTFIIIR